MTPSTEQTALLALIERAYAAQNEWVASLSDAERDLRGTPEQWGAKDLLAHTTFWQQVMAERLGMVQRGAEPQMFDDFQPVNERTFAERHDYSWQRVLDEAAAVHVATANYLRAFDTQTLTDPQLFPWNHKQSLASSILSNSFWHPLEHAARFYLNRGEPQRATSMMDMAIVNEPALAVFPFDRGTALFNVACVYATTGLPERALALLPESFALRPDLVAWSREDSDLDAIRDDPAFQALVAA